MNLSLSSWLAFFVLGVAGGFGHVGQALLQLFVSAGQAALTRRLALLAGG